MIQRISKTKAQFNYVDSESQLANWYENASQVGNSSIYKLLLFSLLMRHMFLSTSSTELFFLKKKNKKKLQVYVCKKNELGKRFAEPLYNYNVFFHFVFYTCVESRP